MSGDEDYWEGFQASDFITDCATRSIREINITDLEECYIKKEIKRLPGFIINEVFTKEQLEDLNV